MKNILFTILRIASLSVIPLLLANCGGSGSSGYDFEANTPKVADTDTSEVNPPLSVLNQPEALFDPSNAILPTATNLLFTGTTDGTLNIPVEDPTDFSNPRVAINALDGFGTSGPISTAMESPVNSETIAIGETVRVFELTQDPATLNPTDLVRELSAQEVTAVAVGSNLVVQPIAPLKPSTQYMVVLTNGLTSTSGLPFQSSLVYSLSKTTADLSTINAALTPLQALVNGLENIASAAGVNADDIILSWNFTTQSIHPVLSALEQTSPTGTLTSTVTGLTTADVLPGSPGLANVSIGRFTLPYYLSEQSASNPAAPASEMWKNSSGNQLAGVNLLSDPLPAKTTDQAVPVIFTTPQGTPTATGWPIVIFQHGITQDRSNVLAIADSLAAAGMAAIAIDLPLHGIVGASPLAYPSTSERLPNLDCDQNGSTSSGECFINLSNLLVSRDNIRQGAADLMTLANSLDQLPNIDESNISFIGHSLGGIVGTVFLAHADNVNAATLAMPGARIPNFLVESAAFGPTVLGGLSQAGVTSEADIAAFIAAAQIVLDSADPINYGADAAMEHPIHMIEAINETVIPNTAAGGLAGTEILAQVMGLQSVAVTTTTSADNGGIVRFLPPASHGSIIDPSSSASATAEMQSQVAKFLASGGAAIVVSDVNIVAPAPSPAL